MRSSEFLRELELVRLGDNKQFERYFHLIEQTRMTLSHFDYGLDLLDDFMDNLFNIEDYDTLDDFLEDVSLIENLEIFSKETFKNAIFNEERPHAFWVIDDCE